MIWECIFILTSPFPNRVENNHVISGKQIFVSVVPKGPSGIALSSTFTRRDNAQYITELGDTVLSVCETTPDGVLCFFTSYGIMAKSIESWKKVLDS
jgi:regulator of telomere elongation helicase 1